MSPIELSWTANKKVQINNAQGVYLLDLYLEVFLSADC